MSEIETTTVVVQPGEESPRADHTDDYYVYLQTVKHKGRKKKTDPTTWTVSKIPWELLNDSELISICLSLHPHASREEMKLWEVLHRGVRRRDLIGVIMGRTDVSEMEPNPMHDGRERLARAIYEQWKYINTQLRCNTCCWECPDAKVLECVREEQGLLRSLEL